MLYLKNNLRKIAHCTVVKIICRWTILMFWIFHFRYSASQSIIDTYAKNCTTYFYTKEKCIENNISTCFDMSREISCTNYVHDMKSDDAFWSLPSEYDWVCDRKQFGSKGIYNRLTQVTDTDSFLSIMTLLWQFLFLL